jgi:hypothetical protein
VSCEVPSSNPPEDGCISLQPHGEEDYDHPPQPAEMPDDFYREVEHFLSRPAPALDTMLQHKRGAWRISRAFMHRTSADGDEGSSPGQHACDTPRRPIAFGVRWAAIDLCPLFKKDGLTTPRSRPPSCPPIISPPPSVDPRPI